MIHQIVDHLEQLQPPLTSCKQILQNTMTDQLKKYFYYNLSGNDSISLVGSTCKREQCLTLIQKIVSTTKFKM